MYHLFIVLYISQSNQRELDREMRELDRQEKQVTMELKQRAKVAANMNDPTLKTLAKQLVNVRQQRTKLQSAKAQVGALGMHATATAAQVAAVTALGSVTEALKPANEAMNIQKTNAILKQFQMENERMAITEEMMDDALASVFDADGVEEEAEEVTQQVLAELGVELDTQLMGLDAPRKKVAANAEEAQADQALDDLLPDLKARLNAL
jgi:charged multivesicular body protein 2B